MLSSFVANVIPSTSVALFILGPFFCFFSLTPFSLFLQLQSLLLLSRQSSKLALGAEQVAAWVDNGKEEKSEHHREAIERVGVLLVKRDWVVVTKAPRELDDPKNDTDLFYQRGSKPLLLADLR